MRSIWYSVRALVTTWGVVVFGGTMCAIAVLAALGLGDKEMGLVALGGIGGFVAGIATFYFASPSGASGSPHAPTT